MAKLTTMSTTASNNGIQAVASDTKVPDQTCRRTIIKIKPGIKRQSCSIRNCMRTLSSSMPLRTPSHEFPNTSATTPTSTPIIMIWDVLPSANAVTMFVGSIPISISTKSPRKSPPLCASPDCSEKKGMQIRQAKIVAKPLSIINFPTSDLPLRPSAVTSPMPQMPQATVKKMRGPARPLSIAKYTSNRGVTIVSNR